ECGLDPLVAGEVDTDEACHGGPFLKNECLVVVWWCGRGASHGLVQQTSHPGPGGRSGSSLALLVPGVVADHHDPPVATDHLAAVAYLLHAGVDLHQKASLRLLSVLTGALAVGPVIRLVNWVSRFDGY